MSLQSPFLSEGNLKGEGARAQRAARASSPLERSSSAHSVHRAQSGSVTIERHNLGTMKLNAYYQDLFHTLVNMPGYRFYVLFLAVYPTMYVFFAALYFSQPEKCISNTHGFVQTLWFSVHTSATIGYGHMAPHPECTLFQAFICIQVLVGLLLQASMLGVVYARFSTPIQRAHTIRFSKHMTLHKGSDGYSRLSFRLANLRKHQVLRPELCMLLLRKQRMGGAEEWVYTDLPTRHAGGGGRLWLGVPTVLRHVIDERSPLFGVELQDMVQWGWEIVVLLDGYDETTSMPVQARHAYLASHIQWDT